jgi:hypothetical protein
MEGKAVNQPVLALGAAVVLAVCGIFVAACGTTKVIVVTPVPDSPTAPRPVPAFALPTTDTPRYSARDVGGILSKASQVSCTRPTYTGDGIWKCGTWLFDERTGTVREGSSGLRR